MNARLFQNALRIMHSLDEVADVLPADQVAAFHRDPMAAAMRMDESTWEKVYELIKARQPVIDAETIERVSDAIAEQLGDTYDCTRVWEAWSHGTMSAGDFVLVAEDSDRIFDIATAAANAALR